MGLSRSQRVGLGPPAKGPDLQLTPQEYYVLSRIEGTPSVGEIVAMTGLGRAAEEALERLVELGVVVLAEPSSGNTRPAPVTATTAAAAPTRELRQTAQERRRRLLEAQLNKRPTGEMPAIADGPDLPGHDLPAPDLPAPAAELEADEAGHLEPVLVASDDPRLDPSLPLPIEQQRRVLALADRLDDADHFEVLGLRPTHDLKRVRRAYHEVSRRLHPDAYYGRDLGPYRELLATLFHRAKVAHTELANAEVRKPLVERFEAELERQREEARRRAELAERELAERQRRADEESARVRKERAAQQVRQQRDRAVERLQAEAAAYVEQAERAVGQGKLAQAANLYRLALRADPGNATLRDKWEDVRNLARRRRAADAFHKAINYAEIGHAHEAALLFSEAATADPTVEHLAHAADAVRHHDPAQARSFALSALDALGAAAEDPAAPKRRPAELGSLHLMIARAFLSAGQAKTAKEQILIAGRYRPDDPEVRALLNSIKVT